MRIQFLKPEFPNILSYIFDFYKIYRNNYYSNNGPYVQKLESAFQAYFESKTKPILVNNATLGLIAAFRALQLPLNSYVIVPSFTFSATIEAILWAGLKPLYCDISPNDFNIDPVKIEELLKKYSNVSAICPVSCFGYPCSVYIIDSIANRYKVEVVYDSAGAIGAKYGGNLLGNNGSIEVFSLHATKLLPIGEGGLVVCSTQKQEEYIRSFINFGFTQERSANIVGMNAKLPEFSAAIGMQSLKKLDRAILKRNKVVRQMKNIIYANEKLWGFSPQTVLNFCTSTYQIFSILAPSQTEKKKLVALLNVNDIETREYFNPPCHLQSALSGTYDSLEVTEDVSSRIISLPIWNTMKKKELNHLKNVFDQYE